MRDLDGTSHLTRTRVLEAEASLLGTGAHFNGRGTPNGAPAPSSP
jgi:hypothetical protein